MKLYIIRHGETDWNVALRLQGREDIPLNTTGIKQAEACGAAMSSVKLDLIISSPLQRAYRTAEIIQSYQENTPVLADSLFIERDFGNLSGMTYKERKVFMADHESVGLESRASVSQRICTGLRQYTQKGYEAVAVVSHGGLINQLLADYSAGRIGSGKTRLKNACISVLEYEQENYTILAYNLTADAFQAWQQSN